MERLIKEDPDISPKHVPRRNAPYVLPKAGRFGVFVDMADATGGSGGRFKVRGTKLLFVGRCSTFEAGETAWDVVSGDGKARDWRMQCEERVDIGRKVCSSSKRAA